MIKLETHCHVIGGSWCAVAQSKTTVERYKKLGYKAIAVTTHLAPPYYNWYPSDTHKGKIDYFFGVYDGFSALAKEQGIKTFYGAEVLVKDIYSEYIVIGFDREFLYDNPPLFELTQKELFELVNKYNLFMYQTHPYREGIVLGNPKYMHGAESFNGHYHHKNNNDLAKKFCFENGLVGLSGTDYHYDIQPITAGIYIPKEIETEKQLAKFYFENNIKTIEDEEKYIKYHLAYKNGQMK